VLNYEYFIIMRDVAAYRVLFPVQGVMWTGYNQSTYLPALETTHAQIHDMLPHRS